MGYSIEWEVTGVVKRYFGEVTAAEVFESVVVVESDARFDQLHYVINDFLDVQGMAVTEQDIEAIAVQDLGAALTNPNIKIAMVAHQSEVIAMVQRYRQAAGGVFPTKIFSTAAAARAWFTVSSA